MNPNQNVTVPSALLDNTIRFVEVSSLTAKRALDEVDLHRQAQKRATDLRAPILKHMMACGIIAEGQKEAADAMLGSHAETLNLLKAAADKIVELKTSMKKTAGDGEAVDAASLGLEGGRRGGSSRPGEYNSLTSPMVGEKTAFVKESDRPLLALIGR